MAVVCLYIVSIQPKQAAKDGLYRILLLRKARCHSTCRLSRYDVRGDCVYWQTMSCEDLCRRWGGLYIHVAQGSGPCSCIRVAITTREVSAVTRVGLNLVIGFLGLCFISFPLNKKFKLFKLYFLSHIIN